MKRNFERILSLILLSVLIGACENSGTDTPNPGFDSGQMLKSEQIIPSDDTNTKASYPSQTKGRSEKIDVWDTDVDKKVGFIKFPVPEFSNKKVLLRATLRLHVFDVDFPGEVQFFSVEGDWSESELTELNLDQLNFNYELSQRVLKQDEDHFVEIDLTTLVKKWQEEAITNNGLALYADRSDGPVEVEFSSKEALGFEPKLILEFLE